MGGYAMPFCLDKHYRGVDIFTYVRQIVLYRLRPEKTVQYKTFELKFTEKKDLAVNFLIKILSFITWILLKKPYLALWKL